MKRFLFKIALFFVLVAIIDMVCGWSFVVLRSKSRGGQTHKSEYLCKICEDDILILGSSKADHHYVPRVFEDSLGMSCYNAGEMGCGIIPAYVYYKLVSERMTPKLVVYEVTPQYDYLADNGYSNYLGVIRPYTDNKIVNDVYMVFSDNLEWIRLKSSMYRNNSKLVYYLKDIFTSSANYSGYEPLYGKVNPADVSTIIINHADEKICVDSLKLKYLESLIIDTKKDGVLLLFIISPTLQSVNVARYAPVVELCSKYNVPLIDNTQLDTIANNCDLFQDLTHLNHQGALRYSQIVAAQIKRLKTDVFLK